MTYYNHIITLINNERHDIRIQNHKDKPLEKFHDNETHRDGGNRQGLE